MEYQGSVHRCTTDEDVFNARLFGLCRASARDSWQTCRMAGTGADEVTMPAMGPCWRDLSERDFAPHLMGIIRGSGSTRFQILSRSSGGSSGNRCYYSSVCSTRSQDGRGTHTNVWHFCGIGWCSSLFMIGWQEWEGSADAVHPRAMQGVGGGHRYTCKCGLDARGRPY